MPTTTPTQTPPEVDKKLRETVEAALATLATEISPEKRARVVERVVRRVETQVFQGPLPPPSYLQGYEKACPGAATRIIAMAEEAQKRQGNRLDTAMSYEYSDRRVGLFLAFGALLAILIAGLIAIALGQVAVGSTLMAAGIISTVVGTFVHGRGPQNPPSTRGDDGSSPPERSSGHEQVETVQRPGLLKRIIKAING